MLYKTKTFFDNSEPIVEVITFYELIDYGKANGANMNNGMPWSFKYKWILVTHENDRLYLIGSKGEKMTPDDVLVIYDENSFSIQEKELFENCNEKIINH